MSQEELNERDEAQEEPAAMPPVPEEAPAEPAPAAADAAEVEPADKPRKVIPKMVKGKFKKPEKMDLGAAKGRFAKSREGPVKKLALDRFAKKSSPNKKIILAAIVVAAVLAAVLLFFGAGVKGHAIYINARNTLLHNPEVIKAFYGRDLKEGETPHLTEGKRAKATYGEEQGRETVEIENTVSGEKYSGSFKVKGIQYRGLWKMLYLEVTVESGYRKVLMDKVLTPDGIRNRP